MLEQGYSRPKGSKMSKKVMQREEALDFGPQSALPDEPHFDEEWTVLSARPVVPLDQLNSAAKRHSALKLVGAFMAAIVLGALVALAGVGLRDTKGDVGVDVSEHTDVNPPHNLAEQPVELSNSATEMPIASGAIGGPILVPKTPTTMTEATKSPLRNSENQKPVELDKPIAEDEMKVGEPGAQLIDAWQERRPRRVRMRRWRRERGTRHHRDLLRIEEIFEGRRP
jgi:hypothetical protein